MEEMCKNCAFCHTLWYWNDYPKDKQYGWCCTMFHDTGEDVVMQLDSVDRPGVDMCECFTAKKGNE